MMKAHDGLINKEEQMVRQMNRFISFVLVHTRRSIVLFGHFVATHTEIISESVSKDDTVRRMAYGTRT